MAFLAMMSMTQIIITIRLTLTDGTTEDILIDTSLYSGEDVEIMKGLYTAMEAVYMLNQDN